LQIILNKLFLYFNKHTDYKTLTNASALWVADRWPGPSQVLGFHDFGGGVAVQHYMNEGSHPNQFAIIIVERASRVGTAFRIEAREPNLGKVPKECTVGDHRHNLPIQARLGVEFLFVLCHADQQLRLVQVRRQSARILGEGTGRYYDAHQRMLCRHCCCGCCF